MYSLNEIANKGKMRIEMLLIFKCDLLNLTTVWANSADDKLMVFVYFSQTTGFGISCRSSLLETIA